MHRETEDGAHAEGAEVDETMTVEDIEEAIIDTLLPFPCIRRLLTVSKVPLLCV